MSVPADSHVHALGDERRDEVGRFRDARQRIRRDRRVRTADDDATLKPATSATLA